MHNNVQSWTIFGLNVWLVSPYIIYNNAEKTKYVYQNIAYISHIYQKYLCITWNKLLTYSSGKTNDFETCSFPLPVDCNQFNNQETPKTQIIIYRHTHPKPQSRFCELRPLVLLTEFQPSLLLVRMYCWLVLLHQLQPQKVRLLTECWCLLFL